jgi:hypothetical protein
MASRSAVAESWENHETIISLEKLSIGFSSSAFSTAVKPNKAVANSDLRRTHQRVQLGHVPGERTAKRSRYNGHD